MTSTMNWMTVTSILTTIFTSWNRLTFMTTGVTPSSEDGFWASNMTPSGECEELFISYALQTNAGKAFVRSFKMEIDVIGSARRTVTVHALRSKFQSYSF